jgi:hypothetical protein
MRGKAMTTNIKSISRISLVTTALLAVSGMVLAQAPGGFPGGPPGGVPGRRGGGPPTAVQPPVVASIPTIKPLTGPGKVYDSAGALWPGKGLEVFGYEAIEYVISGTAAGEPYETRLVIRKPRNNDKFSGLAIAEPMHPAAAAAHAFEYNSLYIMDVGHIAVEIDTQGVELIAAFNPERYGSLKVTQRQVSDILAQAGALIKSPQSPIANLKLRKMILWGTSASSQMVVSYLPTHKVQKLASMANIYDGFMPTMNGSTIAPVDVPIIQVPTQHEYEVLATAAQDSDEPGKQFRVYQFAGMAHLDSRNTRKRLIQEDCLQPLSELPIDAFASVALHHLLQWVDKGVKPPRAPRVVMDLFVDNDGSLMQLDQYGNAMGGIRNTYVDVPLFKYTMHNPPNPASKGAGSGRMDTPLLCTLSGYQTAIDAATLKKKYGTPAKYVAQVEKRVKELEAQGWSLPIYREIFLSDAKAVKF